MATITPKLTISANANTATTNPGPMGMDLNLITAAWNLSVSAAEHYTVPEVRRTVNDADVDEDAPFGQVLLDGSDFVASAHSDGTTLDHHGCYIYVLNTSPSTSKHIVAIGHTDDADVGGGGFTAIVDADNNTHADQLKRLFSLRAGEWAFFPYDYTGDLYAQATGSGQSLEWWRFDRTQ